MPFLARARMSRPVSAIGMDSSWMGEGCRRQEGALRKAPIKRRVDRETPARETPLPARTPSRRCPSGAPASGSSPQSCSPWLPSHPADEDGVGQQRNPRAPHGGAVRSRSQFRIIRRTMYPAAERTCRLGPRVHQENGAHRASGTFGGKAGRFLRLGVANPWSHRAKTSM